MELKIEYIEIDKLTPYDKNTRKHEKFDVDVIAKSIEKYGFDDPIGIWSDKNIIVEGHGRLLAAKQLGMDKVPCIRLDHLTDEQRREYAIMHNKSAEQSDWDFDLLSEELADLDLDDFGLDWGLPEDEEEKEIIEDTAPEVDEQAEPICKTGDIWQLGSHRIVCGDSTDRATIERLMDGAKADMVFTDPPYNVAIGSKNAFLNSVQKAGRCTEDIEGDKGLTDEEIGQTLWKPAFENMLSVAKDDCSLYVTMPQGGTHMMMMMMIAAAGWQVKHEIMWLKNSPTFSMGRLDYDYKHEPICYGWAKSHNFYGKGEFTKSVWEIDKPKHCDLHPTMKPLKLICNALQNSTKEGDVIIDFFGGSGSTMIACEQLGRKCYMCEIDPKYCDVILKRYIAFKGTDNEVFRIEEDGTKTAYFDIKQLAKILFM